MQLTRLIHIYASKTVPRGRPNIMGGKKVFELMIEIGDKSAPLTKRTPHGYTHKWTAYVRGVNNSKIEHCVQRVVFQLHESFPTPERVLTEPPYQVRETGYAGFEIPIEVYFKNREKQNSLPLVHDLVLLTDKPNQTSRVEKVTFINPTKDFEKCLIKSGAQLLPNLKKKERSGSPPAKKQKSSSLIPSKDMSKQFQTTTTPGTTNTTISPAAAAVTTGVTSSTNTSTISSSQSAPAKASKNSKEFIDMFGAPLVFGGQSTQSSQPTVSQTTVNPAQASVQPSNSTQSKQSQHNHHHHNQNHQSTPKEESTTKNHHHNNHHHHHNHHHQHHNNHQTTKQEKSEDQPVDELQLIQTKISSLTDSNRLQKIVDIIEEAGEWFNLTSKKFEFDLKRLDKKTLSKIERCLH